MCTSNQQVITKSHKVCEKHETTNQQQIKKLIKKIKITKENYKLITQNLTYHVYFNSATYKTMWHMAYGHIHKRR